MHLAGETDANDVFAGEIRTGKSFANCSASGVPPVFGLLLCPAYLRSREGLMICRSGRNKPTALIHDDGACAASADVNPQYVDKASPTAANQLCGEDHIQSAKDGKRGPSASKQLLRIATET